MVSVERFFNNWENIFGMDCDIVFFEYCYRFLDLMFRIVRKFSGLVKFLGI